QEALLSFNQVLALEPEHQQAWSFRATILIYLERYTEALESCDRVLSLDPTYSEAWVLHGVALYHLKRYKQAYRSYDRALGIERKPLLKVMLQAIQCFIKSIVQ
ncbi:MAG TPA: tetratricopeptide repeat protein, partial [Allocoleopsis sp.]